MMRYMVGALLLAASVASAQAQEIFKAHCQEPYPEAMLFLKETIKSYGYTVSRVQRVDKGLEAAGFPVAKYRVVFFGKPEELSVLERDYPDLIPFLPLKITLMDEGGQAIAVAVNPRALWGLYSNHPVLAETFERWERDIHGIVDAVAHCG